MPARRHCRAFTLVELLVVVGIIALLVAILLPVLGRARRQANTTTCLANLRAIGQTWNIYIAENRHHLPHLFWYNSGAIPDIHWHGFWGGVMADRGLPTGKMLCPEANQPSPASFSAGFGTVYHAWTGQYNTAGTVIRYPGSPLTPWDGKNPIPGAYRVGSYGLNNHVNAFSNLGAPVKGTGRWGDKITHIHNPCEVPLLVDCIWPHVVVYNWAGETETTYPPTLSQALLPTDLTGQSAWHSDPTQHWRFLLSRHGRGVNMLMVDGSAHWTPLEEMFLYQWDNDPNQQDQPHRGWTPYVLKGLPLH